jgi:hypothetical protein
MGEHSTHESADGQVERPRLLRLWPRPDDPRERPNQWAAAGDAFRCAEARALRPISGSLIWRLDCGAVDAAGMCRSLIPGCDRRLFLTELLDQR